MTLRGHMDVITRTTVHLQARNRCGTDDQAETGPESEPAPGRDSSDSLTAVLWSEVVRLLRGVVLLAERAHYFGVHSDGCRSHPLPGVLHFRCPSNATAIEEHDVFVMQSDVTYVCRSYHPQMQRWSCLLLPQLFPCCNSMPCRDRASFSKSPSLV